jgi:hypothetical protein
MDKCSADSLGSPQTLKPAPQRISVMFTHRSPLGLTREGHSSSWPHPFRVTSPEPLRGHSTAAELSTLVFVPLRVTLLVSSTPRETSQASLRSVREFSQLLDGFLRIQATQACFILRPRTGSTLRPGISPLAQLHFLIESTLFLFAVGRLFSSRSTRLHFDLICSTLRL